MNRTVNMTVNIHGTIEVLTYWHFVLVGPIEWKNETSGDGPHGRPEGGNKLNPRVPFLLFLALL